MLEEKEKWLLHLSLSKQWMNNQALENLTEVFQEVFLLHLCFYHSFVMTTPYTWTSVEKSTYWWVCVFSMFLWASAVRTRRRAKLGSKEDTQGGEQVLVFSSLYTPTRTEGYINEEMKGEWVMLALQRITCTWKATIFVWFLEQGILVQVQEVFRTWTEKQKLLNY